MDKKLALEIIYPYKALQEINKKESEDSKNANWCNKLCKLLSNVAHDLEYDNKFTDLVESLQLRGDLLAV